MDTTTYNLDNYKNIIVSGYEYKLPETIINIISNLSNELGVAFKENTKSNNLQEEYTGENKKYLKRNFGNKRVKPVVDEEQWEKIKAFKSTQIEQKEGIEKLINDVRVCLNKISNKNYETHRDTIIQYIKEIIENKETDTELFKIKKSIFEIASTNKFYSELYALLYKDLINTFDCFKENIEPFINEYIDSIQNINYVDPKVDYDKYCDYNKENDKRKAMSAFIVNLSKNDIVEKNTVINKIIYLEELVLSYCDTENKTNELEEITENLFILITKSLSILINEPNWELVINNIKHLAQMKTKEHKSLSSRALFKFMDILDSIKKEQK
uniref:MIF4G domain-containing protein n=1 Tax=viral metagenome TaxID=1070528 RepID=A0A6C0DC62_9ZZZZ